MKNSINLLFASAAIMWMNQPVTAQVFTSNGAQVTITSGAQLTVKGDIQTQGSGSFANSGIIDLSGNWINNSSNTGFSASSGLVVMNGGNQSIAGVSQTNFPSLSVQGTGFKTLQINTTVGGTGPFGQLIVGTGSMDLNSRDLLISSASANGIVTAGTGIILSEDTDNSSRVRWTINSSPGSYVIPFGTSTGTAIPMTYVQNSGNAGIVTFSTYPTAANNTPFPFNPLTVSHVRNSSGTDNSANTVDRFYQVDATGTPNATVTFSYTATEVPANGNTAVQAQRWNDAQDAWEPAVPGQSNPTAFSVQAPFLTSFGTFALALNSSPLPIELIAFTAKAENNERVVCSWATATEIDNDFFTVERSRDGVTFEEIGTVDGAGNSTGVLEYNFTDSNPYNGVSYYRLRQTDFDGRYSNSEIVAVELRELGGISVYPNPAHDEMNLSFDAQDSDLTIQLIDASGRLVHRVESQSMMDGKIRLDVSGFARGMYSVQVLAGSQVQQMKVVLR